MAKTLTSSQLTFVDITDTKKLSIYLTSNLQTIQMRTQTGTSSYTYNPDWTVTNLEINLQSFLDQKLLFEQDPFATLENRLTIAWYVKDGNGAEEQIVDEGGNAFSGEKLVIATNTLQNASSKMLTYICRVTYTEADTMVASTVENQFTYTLIDTAKDAKSCSIRGEQVFKYDINNTVSPASIQLSAVVQNIGANVVYTWQYWNASLNDGVGGWDTYPNATTGSTLTINPGDAVFFNDIAKIKMSPDGSIYDIITIAKVYDGKTGVTGAPGASAYTILLTNESYTFPGTTNSAKDDTTTTDVVVYQGASAANFTIVSVDGITPSTTITNTTTTGLSFAVVGSKITFKSSSNLIAQSGSIPIVIKIGEVEYTKYFSWSVARTGSGACSISIEASSQIFKSSDGVHFTPATITLSPIAQNLSLSGVQWKYSIDGGKEWTDIDNTTNSDTDVFYDNVEINANGETNVNYKTLTVPRGFFDVVNNNVAEGDDPVTSIVFRCICKIDDNTSYTDSITIARLSDGQSAAAAYTVILSNEMQNIATNASLKPLSGETFTCNVTVYEGTTQLMAVKDPDSVTEGKFKVILPTTAPKGIALTQNTAGIVEFTVTSDAEIAASGEINLTIQIESEDNIVYKTISYAASRSGDSGTSPVIFQIFAPNGTVFSNQSGQLRLQTIAYEGATEITNASYQWAAYDPNNTEDLNDDGYKDIDGETNAYYDADGKNVINIQTYRCTMIYNGKNYIATITLEDKSDPYVSEMLTVGGTTFKNGQGGSAVYVIVRSNGQEVDPFPNGCWVGKSYPAVPVDGQYYWLINNSNVTLMKYSGTTKAWAKADDDPQTLTYTWSLMDRDGNSIDFASTGEDVKTGKVIYLTCGDIDGLGTLQCDVSSK